ncbi:hypothetical protein HDA45_004546 [Amycolatopsis umgeniensis]|uniref:Uncharacterized protein n=1 Tax=Amycolatopsis umgeniensis TaxID=336628 RepID=A0A841AZW2_9PSEU|nr:hypothetical protein [Amycolatopsis umgeniensis]
MSAILKSSPSRSASEGVVALLLRRGRLGSPPA